MSKAHDRYADAGAALKEYYTDLETIQDEADRLLEQAEAQSSNLAAAKSQAENPPKDTNDEEQDKLDRKVTALQRAIWTDRTGKSHP